MEQKATFQHRENPDDILIFVIFIRQTADVSGRFYGWDYIATIQVLSGESPLDGESIPISGDTRDGYAGAIKQILKQHPEYAFVPATD